jgi:23S rRNA (uridine2552-2'-O)-methyltransferase
MSHNQQQHASHREPRLKSLKSELTERGEKLSREKTIGVKTAKGRKLSSTLWLRRQLNDPYVVAAKKNGYRSRAAYKLIELDERFNFLGAGKTIIDLGAAPGGWSQICAEKVESAAGRGHVVAVDIQEMPDIPGVTFFHKDFIDENTPNLLIEAAGGKADAVISDMAPFTTGIKSADQLRIVHLVEMAATFSLKVLKKNGIFISKIFENGTQDDLLILLKQNFKSVKHFKPKSSRSNSSEIFVVAEGFKA